MTATLTDLVLATRTLTEQGGACPYQATGTVLGESFCFRFRNDYASLEIGDAETVSIDSVTGDEFAGSLTDDEFEALFRGLLRKHLRSLPI